MNIENFSWYSPRLNEEMEIIRYGHWGPPIIYFPTSGGHCGEFNYYRLQDDVWQWTESGKCQFFAIDGFSMQSWYNRNIHPYHRVQGHLAYENYVIHELIPFVKHIARNDYIGCIGFSFGAYYSVNMICKHPDVFKIALAIGGVYDIKGYLDGYYDMDVYFNNPVDYLSHLDGGWHKDMLNSSSLIVLMGGENDQFIQSTYDLHNILTQKNIRHVYDIWKAPCDHHEFWWKKQVPHFLSWAYK